MITLNTTIENITRVGKTTAKRLVAIGLKTVYDLLLYFPFRYEDFRAVTPIVNLENGQNANVVGTIGLIQTKRSPRKRLYITEALVNDETETVRVIWFNQPFIAKILREGDRVSLSGKAETASGEALMRSPAYEKLTGGEAVHTQGLVPIYHLTANITQKQVRFMVKQVIPLAGRIKDWLPREIARAQKLIPLADAIKKIHFPADNAEIEQARARLAFNELFFLQLQSLRAKRETRLSRAIPLTFKERETRRFVASLPFTLTAAQKKAAWQIIRDIGRAVPMARLLEGDVGSGKTLVACLAMLNTALNGYQSVLMVPTEILARQHFESISKFLGGKTNIALLSRSQFLISKLKFLNNKEITKKIIIEEIKNGNAKIIIGTHALLEEDVLFHDLALAIIDEQHRFGVEQRKLLIKKSCECQPSEIPQSLPAQAGEIRNHKYIPHLLSMTATPIPRSLALALYGDLDLSVIDELPENRKPILTKVVPEEKRSRAYDFIRQEVKKGRQVFVICPLIEMSDKLGVKSAKNEFEKLNRSVFPDLKIGLLHGRLKAKSKEAVMSQFLAGELDILVSTSVVEVGVDVPNASIMMIEGTERFGLAQLHQFRGRVGRSEHQSYCFLFTESGAEKTLRRLNALVDCHDGFALARLDLKFRGPGEAYGTAQKGFPELKIATLFDYDLMRRARLEAEKIVNRDASLGKWPELKKRLDLYLGRTRLD